MVATRPEPGGGAGAVWAQAGRLGLRMSALHLAESLGQSASIVKVFSFWEDLVVEFFFWVAWGLGEMILEVGAMSDL